MLMMRGHHAAARPPSLGPEPTLAGGGQIDCSGRFYRTLTGVIVRGGTEQRLIVVRQADVYSAHCWNHVQGGATAEEAVQNLVDFIDARTQVVDDLIGGIQGAA